MSLLRVLVFIFGLAFLAAGVIGFIPMFFQNGLLLGLFEVNWVHNVFHLGTGIIALLSNCRTRCARWFFRIFGLIYAAIAVIGFVNAGDLWIMHMNIADNILHTAIAVIFLYLGFLTPKTADE